MEEYERIEVMGRELLDELKQIRDLNSTKPDKYDSFKKLAGTRTGVDVAVCYISDLPKMWTPRVGQALLGFPTGLVLLSSDAYETKIRRGGNYVDRIEDVIRYIPRIEFVLACTGWEGDWAVQYVAGPVDSEVCDALAGAFPEAKTRRVEVAEVKRLKLPEVGY